MRTTILAFALFVSFLFAPSGHATLIDRGNGQDANTSGQDAIGPLNWADAWTANLVDQGFSDGRLLSVSVAAADGFLTPLALPAYCGIGRDMQCRDVLTVLSVPEPRLLALLGIGLLGLGWWLARRWRL